MRFYSLPVLILTAAVSAQVPVNDTCAGAVPIVVGTNGPFTNLGASFLNDPGFATPCGLVGQPGQFDVFFTFTPDCDGTATLSTCDGDDILSPGEMLNPQLTAYSAWTCGGGPNELVGCNDNFGFGLGCGPLGWQAQVSFPVLAGHTYLARVAGFNASLGTFVLIASVSTAQLITIGTGCGTPTPTLTGSNPPVLGQPGTITVTAHPNAQGFLLYSAPNLANAYTGFGACTIYVQNPGFAPTLSITTDAAGVWSFTDTFPADPIFDCFSFDIQGVVLGVAGFEFTNALRLVIGT